MGDKTIQIVLNQNKAVKIKKWKVKEGMLVSTRQIIFIYDLASPVSNLSTDKDLKFKSSEVGTVRKIIAKEGDIVQPGDLLLELEECNHPTVMKDMCAECGADLRKNEKVPTNASVPMVHSIPELKVSEEQAQIIGKADEKRLLADRKLVLLVDLDQTLIHTTNDNIPPNLKDVYHFRLYEHMSPWYHTRIRPRTHKFLEEISKCYELHICTFGARNYAHVIAKFLDPEGKYFSQRILSRDECFSANSKTANLKALFPCGDNMVCIIDDREDVWNYAANLIHVKPYHFFKHTGDINAPPGLTKNENDEIDGFDFSNIDKQSHEDLQRSAECSNSKKTLINSTKSKTEKCGESTTDKDTEEDETDKKSMPKVQTKNEVDDIEKVTGDLQLSEDDSNDTVVDSKESLGNVSFSKECKNDEKLISSNEKNENKTAVNISEEDTKHKKAEEEISTETDDQKAELSTEIGDQKAELSTEIDDQKAEVSAEIDDQKAEINAEIDDQKAEVKIEKEKNSEEVLAENKKNELIEVEDPDDYLMYLEDILKTIHKAYYTEYDLFKKNKNDGTIPHLKEVIPNVKKQVLKDCHLVFSGLVPSHISLQQSRAYLVAISLGATVSSDISPGCTHLVAARPGTAKVNSSRRQKGITIVTPLWLWHCAERWERLDERLYPLGRGGIANRIPPAHCGSPEHNIYNESEQYSPGLRNRSPSGRFIDTINPLLTFSSEDMKIMDKEVDDLCKEDDDDDDDDDDSESELDKTYKNPKIPSKVPEAEDSSTSSSENSLSGVCHPKGWSEKKSRKRKADTTTCTETENDEEFPSVKFRRGEPLPSDLDFGDDSQDTMASDEVVDDVDDREWNRMGAALEREFLSED